MSERETVLSAIEAVILLNEEAGVNNESLALVRAVSEGRQKVDFDLFCKDIMIMHGSLAWPTPYPKCEREGVW